MSQTPNSQQPKGYLFAELEVTDPTVFYNEYMPRVRPVLKQFGARFLAGSDQPEVHEGDRHVRRVVLLEFESIHRAREFYGSPEYQAVIGHRLRSASTHLYTFEGFAP